MGQSAMLSLGLSASMRVMSTLAPFIREKIKPRVTLAVD